MVEFALSVVSEPVNVVSIVSAVNEGNLVSVVDVASAECKQCCELRLMMKLVLKCQ